MDIENLLKDIISELIGKIIGKIPTIEVAVQEDGTYKVNVTGLDNAAMLIGYHGETLHALQHIFKTIAFKQIDPKGVSVTLDIDNYKKEHEDNIIGLAERKVQMLRRTKNMQILPPMPAYLRRLVHMHLTKEEFKDIQTESIGSDEHRQVTIKLKSE